MLFQMFLKPKVYTNVEMGFIFLKIKTGSVVYLQELFTSLILSRNREDGTHDGWRG